MGIYRDIILEKGLTSRQRNNIDEKDFGIPELRKFPLIDKRHVTQAIIYFNKADNKYRSELAKNIISKMKKFNMDTDVSKDNPFYKYYAKSSICKK